MGLLHIPMPCLFPLLRIPCFFGFTEPMLRGFAFQDLVEHTRALQSMGKAKRWDLSLALLQHLQDDLVQAGKAMGTAWERGEFKGTGLSFWEVETTVPSKVF